MTENPESRRICSLSPRLLVLAPEREMKKMMTESLRREMMQRKMMER